MEQVVEKVKICCLKGIGSSKVHPVIPLTAKDEVTIGRLENNTVCINSDMISRKHAILKKNADDKWSITDNKSLNGIFINGKKITPLVPHLLSEADQVQLGVKVAPDKPPDYLWKFCNKLSVKKLKQRQASVVQHCHVSSSQSQDADDSAQVAAKKRPASSEAPSTSTSSPGKSSPRHPCKRSKVSDAWSPSKEMQQRLAENEAKVKAQLLEQQQRLAEMEHLLAERETAKEKLKEELERKETTMKEELQKQQEALEAQRKEFEAEVRKNFEEQIQEKEQSLMARLSDEKAQLLAEKRRIEESLQTEMERKLGEKDKAHEERLVAEMDKLDKVIKQKELTQNMLETQLNETKSENQKQKETMLHTKENILSNFTDLIETELQCSICNELFVKATSLNCSHIYCAMCIADWMKVKRECPVCRAPITSHLRSIVLDSYIDRMVEFLSEDMKAKRQELVEERKAEETRREAAVAATAAAATNAAAAARGRGRGRGGRGGGRRGRQRGGLQAGNPPPPAPAANAAPHATRAATRMTVTAETVASTTVVISSDNSPEDIAAYVDIDLGSDFSMSEDDDAGETRLSFESGVRSSSDSSSESSSESSVEGDPDVYYGGYGECFRCGRRGHWANGCPDY